APRHAAAAGLSLVPSQALPALALAAPSPGVSPPAHAPTESDHRFGPLLLLPVLNATENSFFPMKLLAVKDHGKPPACNHEPIGCCGAQGSRAEIAEARRSVAPIVS